jgi:hypothetical protein
VDERSAHAWRSTVGGKWGAHCRVTPCGLFAPEAVRRLALPNHSDSRVNERNGRNQDPQIEQERPLADVAEAESSVGTAARDPSFRITCSQVRWCLVLVRREGLCLMPRGNGLHARHMAHLSNIESSSVRVVTPPRLAGGLGSLGQVGARWRGDKWFTSR